MYLHHYISYNTKTNIKNKKIGGKTIQLNDNNGKRNKKKIQSKR